MTPRARWTAYALAGLATLAAITFGEPAQDDLVAAVESRPRAAPTAAAEPVRQPPELGFAAWPQRSVVAPRIDPFSATPPAPPPVAAAARQAADPPPAPVPPSLPFAFMGTWQENGQTTVLLARGDRHLSVKGIGPIDNQYVVDEIAPQQIVLRYLPLDARQVLSWRAGDSAGPASPSSPVAPSQDSPEEESN